MSRPTEVELTIAAYDNYTRTLDEALRYHHQCQNQGEKPGRQVVAMYRRLIADAAQRTERYDLLEVINHSTLEERQYLLDSNTQAGKIIAELPTYYFGGYDVRTRDVLAQIPGVLRNLYRRSK